MSFFKIGVRMSRNFFWTENFQLSTIWVAAHGFHTIVMNSMLLMILQRIRISSLSVCRNATGCGSVMTFLRPRRISLNGP